MKKRKDAKAEAQQAADRAVELARHDLELWELTTDKEEIERRRQKLARRMAHAARLRRKFKQEQQ